MLHPGVCELDVVIQGVQQCQNQVENSVGHLRCGLKSLTTLISITLILFLWLYICELRCDIKQRKH